MEGFSPTHTVLKPSSQINLTGNRRVIKDLAADIHTYIQRWNGIHLHGLSVLKSIVAMKVDNSYPCGLQELCDKLKKDVDQLDEIVECLRVANSRIKSILCCIRESNEKLFSTWPKERFGEVIEQIYGAYKNEVMLKRKILEDVAHRHEDTIKMIHLSAWAYQPMIPHNDSTIIEFLLIETGHR